MTQCPGPDTVTFDDDTSAKATDAQLLNAALLMIRGTIPRSRWGWGWRRETKSHGYFVDGKYVGQALKDVVRVFAAEVE